jgi:hypothetical protein
LLLLLGRHTTLKSKKIPKHWLFVLRHHKHHCQCCGKQLFLSLSFSNLANYLETEKKTPF